MSKSSITRKQNKQEEKALQKQFLDWLRYQPNTLAEIIDINGIFLPQKGVFKKSVTTPGFPDIIFFIGPIVGLVEVKLPGKKQSNSQKEFGERCYLNSTPYNVCTTLEELQAFYFEVSKYLMRIDTD